MRRPGSDKGSHRERKGGKGSGARYRTTIEGGYRMIEVDLKVEEEEVWEGPDGRSVSGGAKDRVSFVETGVVRVLRDPGTRGPTRTRRRNEGSEAQRLRWLGGCRTCTPGPDPRGVSMIGVWGDLSSERGTAGVLFEN